MLASYGLVKGRPDAAADSLARNDPLYRDPDAMLVTRMERSNEHSYYRYDFYANLDAYVRRCVEHQIARAALGQPAMLSDYCMLRRRYPVTLYLDLELELERHTLGKTERSKQKRADYTAQLEHLLGGTPYASYDFDRHAAQICWALRCCLEALYGRSLQHRWAILQSHRAGKKYSLHVHVPTLAFCRSIDPQEKREGVVELHDVVTAVLPWLTALLGPLPMLAFDGSVYTRNRNMRMAFSRKEPTNEAPPLVPHYGPHLGDDGERWLRATVVTHPEPDATVLPSLAALVAERVQFYTSGDALLASVGSEVIRAAFEVAPRSLLWTRALQLAMLALRYYDDGVKTVALEVRIANLARLASPTRNTQDSPYGISVWRELVALCKCMFAVDITVVEYRTIIDRRWTHAGMLPHQVFALCVGPVRFACLPEQRRCSYAELHLDDLQANVRTLPELMRAIDRLPERQTWLFAHDAVSVGSVFSSCAPSGDAPAPV